MQGQDYSPKQWGVGGGGGGGGGGGVASLWGVFGGGVGGGCGGGGAGVLCWLSDARHGTGMKLRHVSSESFVARQRETKKKLQRTRGKKVRAGDYDHFRNKKKGDGGKAD